MNPLGIIASSGGSALATAAACLASAGIEQNWAVVTDRDCGALRWAMTTGQTAALIPFLDSTQFSSDAFNFFRSNGVEDVLLFFTRRISPPLITQMRVCNIHPSLLPELPGLGAVKSAIAMGSRRIGATLHLVDERLDTGPIIFQVASELPKSDLEHAEHVSYLQKVLLTLKWQAGLRAPDDAIPPLPTGLLAAFERVRNETAAITDVVACGS